RRELRDMSERSMEFYHRYFERRGMAARERQDILSPYLVASETHFPDFMALIKAMAEGAMVPVWELFAVNAFEELEPILEPVEGGSQFLMRKEGRAPTPASPAPRRN